MPASACSDGTLEPRSVAIALAALTVAGAVGAALSAVGTHVVVAHAPVDALPATPGTALELFAHNARVALWPLALIALRWPWTPGLRRLGDVLVAGTVLGHGATLGSALVQQPALWRYLPHLPLEWLAIALPASVWLAARRGPDRRRLRVLLAIATAVTGVLVLAALLETYAVPL